MPPLVAITHADRLRRRPPTVIGLLFIPLALASSPAFADQTGALVVRVQDRATGRPVLGASVVTDRRAAPRDRATDADGRVTLDGLAAGECAVTVRAAGFARAVQTVVIKPGTTAEAEFRLDPGASLLGVIRDRGGRPIAGVGLSASPWSGVRVLKYDAREAVTNAAGRYRLDHLAVGTPLMIDVIRRDYFDGESVVDLAPGVQPLDLTLRPRPDAGALSGVVVDPQGRPVVAATVLNRRHNSVEHCTTRTDAAGRFSLASLYENKVAGPNLLVTLADPDRYSSPFFESFVKMRFNLAHSGDLDRRYFSIYHSPGATPCLLPRPPAPPGSPPTVQMHRCRLVLGPQKARPARGPTRSSTV